MTGKTHVITTTAAAATLALILPTELPTKFLTLCPLAMIPAVMTASVLPDIDLHTSTLGSKVPFLSALLTHRGITHTLLVPVILVLLAILYPKPAIAVPFGFILTCSAVPLFDRKIKLRVKGVPVPICAAIVLAYAYAICFYAEQYIPSLLCGVAAGWFAHIIEDCFNGTGCPVFWPMTKKKVHIAKVRTGKTSEKFFSYIWCATCFAGLFALKYNVFV